MTTEGRQVGQHMNEGTILQQSNNVTRAVALLVMSAALAFALLAISPASPALAGCPGCGEYKLDLPKKTGNQEVEAEPESAPAPAPVTTPAPVPTTATETVPVTTESEPAEQKPEGPDPKHSVDPVSLTPVVPASEVEASSSFPLLALLAAVGGLGALAGLIRWRTSRSGTGD